MLQQTTESVQARYQEEMDSYEEVRHSFAGPGEIKRREVVPLDPQQSSGEIKTREVEL